MSNSMKKKLIDYEERMSREEAATLLESVARKMREEGSFTINAGGQSHFVEPAESVKLEIEFEEKNGEYELEFEIEWKAGDSSDQQISIE